MEQEVNSSCKTVGTVKRFNNFISSEKQKAKDVFTRLELEGQLQRTLFAEIKKQIARKQSELTILAFGKEVIAQLKEAGKHGNAPVYQLMLNSVSNFIKGKDFPMRQLSFKWLKKYEAWFLGKGNSINGLGVNMRTLRALINRAIKEKRLSKDYYPFDEYRIQKEDTRKRAISIEDIKKLKQFELQTERQRRAKDYFFISFYLMGASFVDIAYLKLSDILGDRIEYKRRKTGRLHSIILTPPLQALLDIYLKGKGKDDFILNIIKSENPERQIVNIRDELRRYNRSLKEIGQLCGIAAPLTSYVSRHSYATIAKHKGVPTAVISEALGHSSEEVTQVYLDSFDKEVLDSYHQLIIA